jgi:hypothetical protein
VENWPVECKRRAAIEQEMEANARLIAAAPDLYAAIRNSDDAHWTTAMRAAMAKVEGKLSSGKSGEP